ncbi:MAG: ring-hydroxylating dioxygenase subunit beta [Betaproteobacteria bacterium]|nr:ring-hydroxylating dioxygenase subunit beta [Betaproteobacteria bacterium]
MKIAGYEQQPVDARLAREARWDVEEFHAAYCQLLDLGDIEQWADFFTTDCLYIITARENAEADLPVGLVYAEGRDMIRDRAFAVRHTQMFAPRYLQHFVSNVLILAVAGNEIRAQSNYQLLQTLVEGPTTLLQAGRYYDTFWRENGRLLIEERRCIYDTTLIANDLVLPV